MARAGLTGPLRSGLCSSRKPAAGPLKPDRGCHLPLRAVMKDGRTLTQHIETNTGFLLATANDAPPIIERPLGFLPTAQPLASAGSLQASFSASPLRRLTRARMSVAGCPSSRRGDIEGRYENGHAAVPFQDTRACGSAYRARSEMVRRFTDNGTLE
jgi:hypothetical protein